MRVWDVCTYISLSGSKLAESNLSAGIGAFWNRILDGPDAFPPEVSELFLPSNRTALGKKFRPLCVVITWRRLTTAGVLRECRPPMEELSDEARQ